MNKAEILQTIRQELPDLFLSPANKKIAANDSFDKEFNDWVHDDEIISFKVSLDRYAVLIVTYNKEQNSYNLIRIFPSTMGTWNTSLDINSKPLKDIFDYLL